MAGIIQHGFDFIDGVRLHDLLISIYIEIWSYTVYRIKTGPALPSIRASCTHVVSWL